MPFKNTNQSFNLNPTDDFQAGFSDVDSGAKGVGVLLPWPSAPEQSWVYYNCTVVAVLDSGIVVHHRLPQVDHDPDTLASCEFVDGQTMEQVVGGVNLYSRDVYRDVQQRMGHSRYWFRLFGQALRIGLQVPIPGIKTIGGVPAIPHDEHPQMAFNRIVGGYGANGIPLWHAAWSLWYTTLVPPNNNFIPTNNLALHTDGSVEIPNGLQVPLTIPDDNAASFNPIGGGGFIGPQNIGTGGGSISRKGQ